MVKKKKKAKPAKKRGAIKKKPVRKRRAEKEENAEVEFEEVVIRCPSCGREFRIVKSAGFSTEGMLCQRCSAGGGVSFEDEGD